MSKQVLERKRAALPSISIILCFARSGGTMLNRWLLNSKDVIVLSEVNPANEKYGQEKQTIVWQAKAWYGVDLKEKDYIGQILELHEWCMNSGKHLIIREWPYIDFMPCSLNEYNPVGKSSSYELLKDKVDLNIIAFVRDAIDVYLSLEKSGCTVDEFAEPYKNYVNYLIKEKIPCIKYEDFCVNPQSVGDEICNMLALPPIRDSGEVDNSKLTGDVMVSRGNRYNKVIELKRRYIPRGLRYEINESVLFKHVNELLNYPVKYESKNHTSFLENTMTQINCILLEYLRRVKNKMVGK